MKMNKILLIVGVMAIMLCSIAFAQVSWSAPSSVSSGQQFNVVITAGNGDDGGYIITKPSNCQSLGPGTLGTDGKVRGTMASIVGAVAQFSCTSSAYFSGQYTTGTSWNNFNTLTVTVDGTAPPVTTPVTTQPPSVTTLPGSSNPNPNPTPGSSCQLWEKSNNGVCEINWTLILLVVGGIVAIKLITK